MHDSARNSATHILIDVRLYLLKLLLRLSFRKQYTHRKRIYIHNRRAQTPKLICSYQRSMRHRIAESLAIKLHKPTEPIDIPTLGFAELRNKAVS